MNIREKVEGNEVVVTTFDDIQRDYGAYFKNHFSSIDAEVVAENAECDLCGSNNTSYRGYSTESGSYVALIICAECGHHAGF